MVQLSDRVRDALANQLKVQTGQIQKVVDLLTNGASPSFITTYRHEETGGLDGRQIATIRRALDRAQQLENRRNAILTSTAGHPDLNEDAKAAIEKSHSLQHLEDLYLPYKRRKPSKVSTESLSALAKLAQQVREQKISDSDLSTALDAIVTSESEFADRDAAQTALVSTLAEQLSYTVDVRKTLRDKLRSGAQIKCREFIETYEDEDNSEGGTESDPSQSSDSKAEAAKPESSEAKSAENAELKTPATEATEKTDNAPAAATGAASEEPPSTNGKPDPSTDNTNGEAAKAPETSEAKTEAAQDSNGKPPTTPPSDSDKPAAVAAADGTKDATKDEAAKPAKATVSVTNKTKPKKSSTANTAEVRRQQRRESRKKKRENLRSSFKSYFSFSEKIGQITPPKILNINRGERVRILEVTLKADQDALRAECQKTLVPAEHAHREIMLAAAKQAFENHMLPGVERDLRRELTERAERYAVKVFSRNMRELLLQPPLAKRILAIDPGLRYGCKAVALDARGQLLGETTVHALGDANRVAEGRRRMVELINKHGLELIAIGNGTGVRQTETTVAAMIAESFADNPIAYTVVNESGTSVYSTSPLANDELPDTDPRTRAAVAIGRRVINPLSEFVKVDPDQIGSGIYQQDVKLKHLRPQLLDSLSECVNEVGVDVNSANPSLLQFVSGLDEAKAVAITEHRLQNKPFDSLDQIKSVSGFTDQAWDLAVGFLRVYDGSEPLDATSIHPSEYESARKLIAAAGLSADDLKAELASSRNSGVVAKTTPTASTTQTAPAEKPAAPAVNKTDEAKETTETNTAPSDEAKEPAADASTAEAAAEPSDTTSESSDSPSTEASNEATKSPTTTAEAPKSEAVKEEPKPTEEPKPAPAKASEWSTKISGLNAAKVAGDIGCSETLAKRLITALRKPGCDCRLERSAPIMRRSSLKWEDLQPEMEVVGTVLSVVDFGAFVDLGIRESGLVHISELGNGFVRDPHEVVSVGDSLRLWITKVDQDKRRVSLSVLTPEERKKRAESGGQQRNRRSEKGGGRSRSGERGGKTGDGKQRGGGRKQRHERASKPRSYEVRPKGKRKPKKPAAPITKAMKEGKEPMRTFGDLAQFYTEDKSESKKGSKDSDKKK